MISISTTTFDLDGSRVFNSHDEPVLTAISRRVTRTATLDGGVSIYDGGMTDGDRDIVVGIANPSEYDVKFCEYIARNYSEVTVICSEGAFLADPVTPSYSNSKLKFTLYIKEKIS